MKKTIALSLCSFALIGCTIKGSEAPYTYITEEMSEHAQHGVLEVLSTTALDPCSLLELSSDVAIVKIISVDHADMKYAGFIPMTYGTMQIVIPFVGNKNTGDMVDYVKPGGMVSIAEYESSDDHLSIAKRDALRKKAGLEIDKENTYYDILLGNDVEVIAGKTYLAYLDYHKESNEYEVVGLGNGFREINMSIKEDAIDIPFDSSSLQIRNNTTGEFESLQQYIDTYIR